MDAARLCVIAIILALVSLMASEWLTRWGVKDWGRMLEMNFKQTLGSLCLEVNTQLPTESITAVFGLSGAGKTSLINVIGGLTRT